MCRNIGWRMLETCVSSFLPTNGTGLMWACQWSPLAVLFHCPMCLACKIISKWCWNVGQVWIQNLDFILRRAPAPFRNGHLSGWHETIQQQAWSFSEMCLNDVMCLNVCHVLVWRVWNWRFSTFLYTYWLQVMEHPDFHETMDWILESPAPLVRRPVWWLVFYVKNDKVGLTHVT